MIKEYCENARIAIIRNGHYGHSLAQFMLLFKEAKKVKPSLKLENVTVIHFGGVHYANTWGIEFSLPERPEGYDLVAQVELNK